MPRARYEQAQTYAQAACDVCQQTEDRWFMAYCLNELGQAARALGDYPAAQRHFEASYALREQFSDWEGMALALNNLGDVALRRQQAVDSAMTCLSAAWPSTGRSMIRGDWPRPFMAWQKRPWLRLIMNLPNNNFARRSPLPMKFSIRRSCWPSWLPSVTFCGS
jgi:tetratricopeptide (TPR) repeat protein